MERGGAGLQLGIAYEERARFWVTGSSSPVLGSALASRGREAQAFARMKRLIGAWIGAALTLGLAGGIAAPVLAETPPSVERSDVPSHALLTKLGQYALRFEQMEKRGSFLLEAQMDELDANGKIDARKELVVRSTATPHERVTEILRYFEDGTDKTEEARKKAAVRARSKDPKNKRVLLPFLPREQGRYSFRMTARNPRLPGRVRVSFRPLAPDDTTWAGSAWVDETTGDVLSLGFSPSETPLFIERVVIQVQFEHQTALGRAPSSLTFEARGGLLFIKKHYTGSAQLLDPRIAF